MTAKPVRAYMKPEQRAKLEARARAHDMSLSAYLVHCATLDRTDDPDDPDAWWDTKTPRRKTQIMRWESQRKHVDRPMGDPLPLEDLQ